MIQGNYTLCIAILNLFQFVLGSRFLNSFRVSSQSLVYGVAVVCDFYLIVVSQTAEKKRPMDNSRRLPFSQAPLPEDGGDIETPEMQSSSIRRVLDKVLFCRLGHGDSVQSSARQE